MEFHQILKDDAVKVLHSICQQMWKTQQWPQDWKRSVFIPIPKKGNAEEYSNYCTIELISHATKVMLKIVQAKLQQYVNCELPDVQVGYRKGRGIRDQIANICWITEKARVSEKHLLQLYWLHQSLWLCGLQLWKILQEMGMSEHLTWLLRNLYAGQEAIIKLDMEQQTGSKLGKEYIKAVYCHPAYLTYRQSASRKMPG